MEFVGKANFNRWREALEKGIPVSGLPISDDNKVLPDPVAADACRQIFLTAMTRIRMTEDWPESGVEFFRRAAEELGDFVTLDEAKVLLASYGLWRVT